MTEPDNTKIAQFTALAYAWKAAGHFKTAVDPVVDHLRVIAELHPAPKGTERYNKGNRITQADWNDDRAQVAMTLADDTKVVIIISGSQYVGYSWEIATSGETS